MRLACLRAPGFPLQAFARSFEVAEGAALATHPAEVDPGRAAISAVSRAALRAGVRAGMGLAQARAVCPELRLEPVGRELLRAAQEALLRAAGAVSPSIEPGPFGLCFAELSGLGRLFPDERAAALELRRAALRARLDARVGVAGTRAAARAAARRGPIEVVPPGGEAAFLAPRPLDAVCEEGDLLLTLRRFGLRTVGDLARLPRDGVGARLGPAGATLHRIACGEEPGGPLQPIAPEEELAESVELEWGVALVEPILFALRQPLDRILARLGERGLRCGGLGLRLALEPHGFCARAVEIAAPTSDPSVLLSLVRSRLERDPPDAPVVGLRLEAHAARPRPGQGRLFGPSEAAPEKIFAAVARVEAMVGAGRVGAPAPRDSHLPGEGGARMIRFDPPPREAWEKETPRARDDSPQAALRLFRPPRPAEVIVERGRPAALQAEGIRGRVVDCAGPFRVEADWWTERPVRLEHWDVSLGDGGAYRIAFDRQAGGWLLQGEYD